MPGGEGGLGEGQEDGGQVWGVPRRVSASRGFFSVSSPCRRPRAGSDPAQVPAWQCRPGRAEQLHFKKCQLFITPARLLWNNLFLPAASPSQVGCSPFSEAVGPGFARGAVLGAGGGDRGLLSVPPGTSRGVFPGLHPAVVLCLRPRVPCLRGWAGVRGFAVTPFDVGWLLPVPTRRGWGRDAPGDAARALCPSGRSFGSSGQVPFPCSGLGWVPSLGFGRFGWHPSPPHPSMCGDGTRASPFLGNPFPCTPFPCSRQGLVAPWLAARAQPWGPSAPPGIRHPTA